MANLASKWPSTLALSVVESASIPLGEGRQIDGYYTLTVVTTMFGLGWYVVMRPRAAALSALPGGSWRVGGPLGADDGVEMV
jgi:hypothetical protein